MERKRGGPTCQSVRMGSWWSSSSVVHHLDYRRRSYVDLVVSLSAATLIGRGERPGPDRAACRVARRQRIVALLFPATQHAAACGGFDSEGKRSCRFTVSHSITAPPRVGRRSHCRDAVPRDTDLPRGNSPWIRIVEAAVTAPLLITG
jgi:hypothetical protein